ncbi:hypothetical protein Tco_0941319 [Tanacetum coccineum]|uniref:Uncharacterized protein n=1 Tax=Tanacetum coccineum TaxID=301880 RepID=A0ABQ5DX73_9ASTR
MIPIKFSLELLKVPQPSGPTDIVADEAVYKEFDDRLVRAATTTSSLEAEQDSGGGLRRQETIGDTISQTMFENVSKHSNDPLLLRGNTLRSAEEIVSLKRRVKKLEQKKRSRTHKLKRLRKVGATARVESSGDEANLGEDASKQERISNIDDDDDITLVNVQDDAEMFDVALKSVKPKVKGIVIEEPSVSISTVNASTKVNAATTTATIPTLRKGIVIQEAEPERPMKKNDQISFDEETMKRLQAEFDKAERLAREKDEANVALTKEWDDIQAKIEADHELAQRLQAEEQEELSDAEKATLFVQLLEKRRKHFAAKRAEEKRNKPPTQS